MLDSTGPAGSEGTARTDTTSAGPVGSPKPTGPAASDPQPAGSGAAGAGAGGTAAGGRHRQTAGRGRAAAAATLAVVALVAGAIGVHVLERPAEASAPDIGAIPVAASTTSPAPDVRQDPTRVPATVRPEPTAKPATKLQDAQPAAPATLQVAGVTAQVVATGVRRDGELEIPETPTVVGWWSGSAPVGSPRNSTVIAGHVDSRTAGVGALSVLRTVGIGTSVDVVDVFRTHHRYKVVARRTYDKHNLPANEVFGVKGPARLVLITCGGPFDEKTGNYKDNVVVYAVPVR